MDSSTPCYRELFGTQATEHDGILDNIERAACSHGTAPYPNDFWCVTELCSANSHWSSAYEIFQKGIWQWASERSTVFAKPQSRWQGRSNLDRKQGKHHHPSSWAISYMTWEDIWETHAVSLGAYW